MSSLFSVLKTCWHICVLFLFLLNQNPSCGVQAIDRPLFKDFWERFRECLTLLRDKHQRTVYRYSDQIFVIYVYAPRLAPALLFLRCGTVFPLKKQGAV